MESRTQNLYTKTLENTIFLCAMSDNGTLAGTLCEVGAGRMEPDAIPGILASCDRSKAGPTFPAKGLFLKEVQYDAPAVDRAAQLTPEPQAI